MKIELGQIVYIIVEAYKKQFEDDVIDSKYYRIAKCKVKECPARNMQQYKLKEIEHIPVKLYWVNKGRMHLTYESAVKEADYRADQEDGFYARYGYDKHIIRPWRKETNGEQ